MPITLHLVRHAQGFHNLNFANQAIPDPYLTPLGHEQCAQLRAAFPHHDRVTHLVASPLRRTLVTCYESFHPAFGGSGAGNHSNGHNNKKVIAQPLLQEVSAFPCDTGSEPEVIRAEYGAWADCGLVDKGWNDKTSPGSKWAPRVEALEERAREARVWFREVGRKSGGEADIVAVTHGGFLHFLTQDWDGMRLAQGTGWDNTEYRSYEFVNPEGDDPEASIRETKTSWRRRRGSAAPLTETEQQQARSVVVDSMRAEFEKSLGIKL